MIYYTTTGYYNHDSLMNSLSKGRDDYFEVLDRMGFRRIDIPVLRPHRFLSVAERLKLEAGVSSAWVKGISGLGRGDVLIIHTPCSEKFYRYASLIEKLRGRGCRIITIVFELETFFNMDYRRFGGIKRRASVDTELRLFEISDAVVVHNDVMKERLESVGVDGSKMFSVGVMDYLRDEVLSEERSERISLDKPVAFAGNLSYEKSQFEYNLPDGFRCNLYGSDYTGTENEWVSYKGVYDPMTLMDCMEGSFGLVWDGNSVDGCTGSYGNYLTFNNPHKIAVYLASGMPVIVWSKAAMAHFVRRENCGLIVDSLREVPDLIAGLSTEDYEEMRLNACRIGNEMRQGVHIRSAVETALAHVEKRMKRQALIIFTREPEAGKTKTRMMPYYSAEQCAELQRCMLRDIAEMAGELRGGGTDIIVSYTGGGGFLRETFGGIARDFVEQRGADLGERMQNAIADTMKLGYDRVLLMGSDIPDVSADSIDDAFELLTDSDIVLGPTEDGGYYLIGMDELHSEPFDVKEYGTGTVYEQTLKASRDAGLTVGEADGYRDIDTPEDAAGFRCEMRDDADMRRSHTGRFFSETAKISVIIPVYNEIAEIDRMMAQMDGYTDECEIIFVDGMSTDGTAERIEDYINNVQKGRTGFRLLRSEKGRGVQMNLGAVEACGDVLFFLHCDSVIPEDFIGEIRRVMAGHDWGCFGVRFPSKNFFMLTNRLISNHRARFRRLPFGDQGIFMDRELFFDMGSYPEQALMEDYELSLRMKDSGYRPGMARHRIVSSARRYGESTKDILGTEYHMWKLRRLYRCGKSPEQLAEDYRDIR